MDIWQIVSMVLPFSFVILQTIIDSLSRKAKTLYVNVKPINKVGAETEKQLQRNEDLLRFLKALTNCGIPLCYGLFVVCFFMYGIWCQYGAHWVKFSFIKCTTLVNVNKLFRTHNTYNFSFCFYARGLFNMSCSTVGNCNFSTQIVLIYLVDVYINSFLHTYL